MFIVLDELDVTRKKASPPLLLIVRLNLRFFSIWNICWSKRNKKFQLFFLRWKEKTKNFWKSAKTEVALIAAVWAIGSRIAQNWRPCKRNRPRAWPAEANIWNLGRRIIKSRFILRFILRFFTIGSRKTNDKIWFFFYFSNVFVNKNRCFFFKTKICFILQQKIIRFFKIIKFCIVFVFWRFPNPIFESSKVDWILTFYDHGRIKFIKSRTT